MTFNWISFVIGLLSGMIGMFLITKISEFIRVVLVAKYMKEHPPKKGGISEEELEEIKKKIGITRAADKEKRG